MEPQRIAQMLQEKGLRPTQQRIAVYDYLMAHPIHPTADTIYNALLQRFPTFSRTTIYNSLHALVDVGLVRTVNIEAEEQRFDGNASDHGHFKCRVCGRLYDFLVASETLNDLCPKGFFPDSNDIYITGVCPSCVKNHSSVP